MGAEPMDFNKIKFEEAIRTFESMIDYAGREQLTPYNDGRKWFYLRDHTERLEQIAGAAYTGDMDFLKRLVEEGKLLITGTIDNIPGKHFLCIYFEDAYFLKPYE